MKMRRAIGFAAAVVASLAFASLAAASEPLRMTNLRIEGSGDAWYTSNVFRLHWDQIPQSASRPRAILYRLYDQQGQLIEGPVRQIETDIALRVEVPPLPGVYSVEAWLEDSAGQPGPPAWATLRFDDALPPPPTLQATADWLGAGQSAVLQIARPEAPLPVSGIRGYAVSLDQGGGGSPCAEPSRCALAETDLLVDGNATLPLGALPEGSTFARVLAVSGSGVASPLATAVFKVDTTPPQLRLRGLPQEGWSDRPLRLTALAFDPLSGMAAAGPAGPFTAIRVDGVTTTDRGSEASAWVTGGGIHQVAYFARDAAGNVEDGELGSVPPATASVGIDEGPPKVRFVPAQDPEEPERIEATVSDALSGPSPERGVIALREVGSGGRFEELPTQVAGNRLIARWDSDSYPRGSYEFLATGFDRAGNAGSGDARSSGPKMILASPLKTSVALEAGFGGRRMVWHRCERGRRGRRCQRETISGFDARPAARSVPFGRAVSFGGRLQSASGAPLSGLEVEVTEAFAAGSEPGRRTTLVRTGPDGGFSLRLAPGPSRDVSVAFAGTRTLTRATARSVHLGVLAGVRLRASATTAKIGGAPIIFSGSLERTGAAPGEGLPVELQFRYPGAGWSEFRTVATDRRGRFRYAYRFSDDDSRGVRFQFRAYLPKKEGWPYEPAFSRPVAVSGR
jgi:hypothetical protein